MKTLFAIFAMAISSLVHGQWNYEAIPIPVATSFKEMYPEIDIRDIGIGGTMNTRLISAKKEKGMR